MEYEVTKRYHIEGIEVVSEIVKDQVEGSPEQRSLIIRSSCKSDRWGTRTRDHTYGCPIEWNEFAESHAGDPALTDVLANLLQWAEATVWARVKELNRKYSSWRSPERIIG
jgi:hypothetical protein